MQARLQQLLASTSGFGTLPLRIIIGLVFIPAGAGKLFGVMGGGGLSGTTQMMSSLGLEPAFLMALLAASSEFFGGLFILLGLLTRPAAVSIAFTMLVAIFTAHNPDGVLTGYELAMVLMFMAISLVISGAGKFGLDDLILDKVKLNK